MFISENKENKIITFEDYPYATYVRVSTDKEEQETSPENQIDICRYWLEKNGFEWNEKSVLFDNGISGTVLLDRPAMQLLLEKARKREIKMVIFKSISRLARDLRDSLEIKETLIAHGVRLVTIEEGYDSLYEGKNDMKFEMFSMFASQLPKTISTSVSASMSAKVRRGEHVGQTPFGYKKIDKKLVINEEEAPTVLQIFSWYNNDGLGFKTITRLLNEELEKGNVASPRNKDKWQLTSVQRIIKNPTYAGIFIHNRYTKVKIGGRKKQIENPREKWTIYENHHPAIITIDEWEKANNKEVINKKTRITPWNELRGLMKCSECGSNMVVLPSYRIRKKDGKKVEWNYIKCSAYRRGGTQHGCVNHTPIRYEDFREFILKKLIRKGKNIKFKIENNLHEKNKKEIAALEKQKKHIEEKNKNLVDMYLEEMISKAEFQVRRKSFEDQIKLIEEKIFVLSKEEEVKIEIENIKDAFEQLNKHDDDLHHAFSTLIDYITIYPDGKVDIRYKFKL